LAQAEIQKNGIEDL
jgi:hypothetical protein